MDWWGQGQGGRCGPAAPLSSVTQGKGHTARIAPSDPGIRGSWHSMFMFYLNREALISICSVSIFHGDRCTFKPPPFPRLLLSDFKAVAPSAELTSCPGDDKEISVLHHLIYSKLTSPRVGRGRGISLLLQAAAAPPPREGGLDIGAPSPSAGGQSHGPSQDPEAARLSLVCLESSPHRSGVEVQALCGCQMRGPGWSQTYQAACQGPCQTSRNHRGHCRVCRHSRAVSMPAGLKEQFAAVCAQLKQAQTSLQPGAGLRAGPRGRRCLPLAAGPSTASAVGRWPPGILSRRAAPLGPPSGTAFYTSSGRKFCHLRQRRRCPAPGPEPGLLPTLTPQGSLVCPQHPMVEPGLSAPCHSPKTLPLTPAPCGFCLMHLPCGQLWGTAGRGNLARHPGPPPCLHWKQCLRGDPGFEILSVARMADPRGGRRAANRDKSLRVAARIGETVPNQIQT